MATPEDLERIEWCKFELADFKRKGQEGYSGDYIRAREKELYELTTPLPKKIADKQEQLASLKKRTIIKSYDDGLYESRLERKIAEMKRKEKGESSPTVSSGSPTSRAVAPTIVFQGGGVAQPRGLHTHTIQEIIQKIQIKNHKEFVNFIRNESNICDLSQAEYVRNVYREPICHHSHYMKASQTSDKEKLIFKKMKDMTLILMWFTKFSDQKIDNRPIWKAWKGFNFDILDSLLEDEYISFSYKSKSVLLRDKGIGRAKELIKKYQLGI